jgi:hypothetical protein
VIYCYSLVEFTFVDRDRYCATELLQNVDSMEAFDTLPSGICADSLTQALEKLGGNLWGAWAGGGLFGKTLSVC